VPLTGLIWMPPVSDEVLLIWWAVGGLTVGCVARVFGLVLSIGRG
jgi:hypothetical protein